MPAAPPSRNESEPPSARRFPPVWYGAGLGVWCRLLALRPPIDRSHLARAAGITAAAAANSALGLLEQAVHGRRIARTPIDDPPLFVLGHWRSGTTLLHNLLAKDPRFVAPTNYQTLFPSHFLLTERLATRLTAALMPSRRPMDEMPFSWGLPGEDEIALLLTTLLSPYLGVAFPTGSVAAGRLDDLRRNLSRPELDRWKQALSTFLKKVTLRTRKPLVLKSPPHTGRIPLLLELFPDARFVYVIRNPYEVFASTRHLRRVLARLSALSRTEPADLDERILTTYSRLYDAYHLHRALVPANRRVEIRFEDLLADPAVTLKRVYDHLGLGDVEPLRAAIAPDLAGIRGHRKNLYSLDAETKAIIASRWAPAFRRYGYLT